MGTVDKTIEIIFAGTDRVSGIISNISGDLDTMGKSMQEVSAPFAAATKQIGLMQIAVAGIGAAAVTAAANVEAEGKKMEYALGLPTEEAERFKEIAKDVYSEGVVDSLASAFDAVTLAQQKFGDNSDTDIGKIVTNANKIQKVFGTDVSESLGAVRTLMTNFGLDSDAAFDFIVAGYQKGLNGSGDFIESVNEFSTQFANGGADAGNFFSILETGFQEGMLGTDRAADAFKEFRVRIQDDSTLTKESLELIGINPEELAANLQSGVLTVNDAFGLIIDKLNSTEDASVIMQAGVGLIGTQFEDLGTKAALSLDTTKTKIEDLKGAATDFEPSSFGVKLTSAWRSALQEITDHSMWKDFQGFIAENAGDVSTSFIEAFSDYDFAPMITKFSELANEIGSIFVDNDIDLTTVEGMKNAIDLAATSIGSLIDITKGQVEALQPIVAVFVDLIKGFNDLDGDTKKLIGSVTLAGTALGVLGGVVVAGGALMTGLGALATTLAGPVGLVFAAGAVGSGIKTLVSGMNQLKIDDELFDQNLKVLNEYEDAINTFPEEISSKLFLAFGNNEPTKNIREIINEGLLAQDYESNVLFTPEGLADLVADVDDVTKEKAITINIDGTDVVLADTEAIKKAFAKLEEKSKLRVEVDTEEIEVATEELTILVGEVVGSQQELTITVPVDNITKAKDEIEKVPTKKMLEIALQGDIDIELANIKGEFDMMQSAVEWKAQLDIAEVEASAKIMEAAFDSVSVGIESTGSLISDLFGSIDSEMSIQARWRIEDQISKENELREKSFKLQEKLTKSQVEYNEARTKAIEDGDIAITVQADGITPAIEMIFQEVLKMAQVTANTEGLELLLGA